MNNTLLYKDYVGSIEYSDEDKVFCGKVLGITSLILYEGSNADELIQDFHDAVDVYIETCKKNGTQPEIAYKGNTNVRLKPETHKNATIYAINHFMSLNNVIELSVENFLREAKA